MSAAIDLDAYFQRIGYAGERAPTLGTLRDVLVRHAEAIPFENLDPLLRRPVRLDAASLERKLVREGRGGYCFEQNLLLSHALTGLGFAVTGLAARVLWNKPPDAPMMALTHALLRVEVNGSHYLADVGFGGQTLTGPLLLEAGVEQATPHGPFRLLREGVGFVMESRVRGAWKPLYRFDLREQHAIDYEVGNWYVSTHPDSHFLYGLMAARTAPGRRYALRNNELTVHHLDGDSERRVLTHAAELREVLEGEFRLTLPEGPEVEAVLARLTAREEMEHG